METILLLPSPIILLIIALMIISYINLSNIKNAEKWIYITLLTYMWLTSFISIYIIYKIINFIIN